MNVFKNVAVKNYLRKVFTIGGCALLGLFGLLLTTQFDFVLLSYVCYLVTVLFGLWLVFVLLSLVVVLFVG